MADPFCVCHLCGTEWVTRDAFIDDPQVAVCGYQVDPRNVSSGLYLFRHLAQECGNTLSVAIAQFDDLYEGVRHCNLCLRDTCCEGRCLNPDDMLRCNAPCRNAAAREVLVILTNRHRERETVGR